MNKIIRKWVESCIKTPVGFLHKGYYSCWGQPYWDSSKMERINHAGDLIINNTKISLYRRRLIRGPTNTYWGYTTGATSWVVARNDIICCDVEESYGINFTNWLTHKTEVIRQCHAAAGLECVEPERKSYTYNLSPHELERRYYMAYPRACAPDGKRIEFLQRNNLVIRILEDVFPEGMPSAQLLYLVTGVDMATNTSLMKWESFSCPAEGVWDIPLKDRPYRLAINYADSLPVADKRFRVPTDQTIQARYKWEPWKMDNDRGRPPLSLTA